MGLRVEPDRGARGAIEILRRKAGQPFEVQSVRILCMHKDFVEAGIETIREGAHYRINVQLKPGLDTRYLQGSLLISGSHPDLRGKKFKFMARLVE